MVLTLQQRTELIIIYGENESIEQVRTFHYLVAKPKEAEINNRIETMKLYYTMGI